MLSRKMKLAAVVLFCALIVMQSRLSYTWADDLGLYSEYDKCKEKTETNTGWEICGAEEIKRKEALLDKTWQEVSEVMKKSEEGLRDGPLAALEEDQKNWKKWLQSACEYYGFFGREGQALSVPGCKVGIIIDRINYLQNLSDDLKERQSH